VAASTQAGQGPENDSRPEYDRLIAGRHREAGVLVSTPASLCVLSLYTRAPWVCPINQRSVATVAISKQVDAGYEGDVFLCQGSAMSVLKNHSVVLTIEAEATTNGARRKRTSQITILPSVADGA
jgi:hypothetical protein